MLWFNSLMDNVLKWSDKLQKFYSKYKPDRIQSQEKSMGQSKKKSCQKGKDPKILISVSA